MAGEWEVLTLREAGVSLTDCDHRTPPAAETGYPYVAIPQLRGGRIEFKDARRISPEHFAEWTRKAKPNADDVVLSRRCNPGETALVSPGMEFALGQNLVLLRADGQRVHPPFLRWLTRGPQWWEQIGKFINVGAVFDSLKCADVPKFELTIPPLPEQRAIAHILGTLDDKIELNRRRNQTLETMARALFQDWFVDFGPVRAKLEGREPYLPADFWQLFPERLDDEGKPEGWEYRQVSDFAELKGGKQLEKEQIAPAGQVPVFGGAGVMGYTNNHNADGFVIAVGRVGAYCGQFFAHRGKAWINNNASLIRQTDDRFGEWLFLSLRNADIDVIKKGAAQPFVSNGDIAKLPLMWPGDNVVHAFLDIVVPVLKKKEQNDAESNALAQLRDTLLPKLISGALRITNAEKFMELTAVRNRMEVTAG